MDAHATAQLPVEEESPALSVRVPGEREEPFAERDFRKEGPEPGVRLPGEAEEPSLEEGLDEECSEISPPDTPSTDSGTASAGGTPSSIPVK
jgi:hypothetical protein